MLQCLPSLNPPLRAQRPSFLRRLLTRIPPQASPIFNIRSLLPLRRRTTMVHSPIPACSAFPTLRRQSMPTSFPPPLPFPSTISSNLTTHLSATQSTNTQTSLCLPARHRTSSLPTHSSVQSPTCCQAPSTSPRLLPPHQHPDSPQDYLFIQRQRHRRISSLTATCRRAVREQWASRQSTETSLANGSRSRQVIIALRGD